MLLIRKAGLEDVENIIVLWKEFMKEECNEVAGNNSSFRPHLTLKKYAELNFKKFIQKSLKSNNSLIHIAEVDGKSAGYSFSYVKSNIPVFKLDKIGYISDLFIKPEYRRMGISSQFKNKAAEWFRKKGIKYMSIMVNVENSNAYKIYKKWGFMDYHLEMRMKI